MGPCGLESEWPAEEKYVHRSAKSNDGDAEPRLERVVAGEQHE